MNKKARREYCQQRCNARQRGIDWEMTFEEWCRVWIESGKYERRGPHKGEYVMCRPGDIGPYHPDNVVIRTSSYNAREAHCLHWKPEKQICRDKSRKVQPIEEKQWGQDPLKILLDAEEFSG